jgi:tryptophan synthase alpha subunit
VTRAEQATGIARVADAVIVGTALSRLVEEGPDAGRAVARVGELATELKQATRRAERRG